MITKNRNNARQYPGLALSKVGAALDTPSFYQELTARENIECFAHLYENIPNGQVMELLDYVGIFPYHAVGVMKQ